MTAPADLETEAELADYYLRMGVHPELATILAAQAFGTFDGDSVAVTDEAHAAVIAEQDGTTPPA